MQSRRETFLNSLRKLPFVYKGLRFICRAGSAILIETIRALAPVKSLFGPPKGYFSDLDLVRQSKVEGKIILPGQNRPILSPDSLRKISGLRQDEFQPWPIYWSRHRNARLVGSTL